MSATTKIQTLIFNRGSFTASKAKSWAKSHGFKYGKVHSTEDSHRLRQEDPDEFQPLSFRTIQFKPGIKAVIGRPFGNPGGKTMAKKKSTKRKKATKRKAAPKRKKATKRKATKRKATPKRKKATKRKSTKKKATKRKPNGTPKKLGIKLQDMGSVMGTKNKLYHAFIKNGKEKMYVGHVVAPNQTQARKKAHSYLGKKLK